MPKKKTIPSKPVDDITEQHDPAAANGHELSAGEKTLPSTQAVPADEAPTIVSETEAVSADEEPTVVSESEAVGEATVAPVPLKGLNKRLLIGAAVAGGLMVIGGIIAGITLLGAKGVRLSEDRPTFSHPDGISIGVLGQGSLSADLGSIPRELFLQREAGADYDRALASIPTYLAMKSPLYTISTSGDAEAMIEIVIPNESQPYDTLDLYTWDAEAGEWRFVPSHVDYATETIHTEERPNNVAVFQTTPVPPLIGTTIESGNYIDQATGSTLNTVYPTGLHLRADGALEGSVYGGWQLGQGYAVIPVIYADDTNALAELLNNEASLALHIEDLSAFVIGDGYNGVALDYRNIDPQDSTAYISFVEQLAEKFHQYNKIVVVFLPRPTQTADAWSTAGYNWRGLGAAADYVVIAGSNDPAAYATEGEEMALLHWAVGEVSRLKIQMATSSLSVQQDSGNTSWISYEDALAGFGTVAVDTSVPEGAEGYEPGTTLTFNLNGGFSDLQADPVSGAYTYTANSGARVWIVTASTVRARLDMANRLHLGGMLVANMLDEGNDGGLITAINECKVNSMSTVPNQLLLEWQVIGASGAVLSEANEIGTPLDWQAAEAGDYTVQAEILGRNRVDRGSVGVRVAALPAETPTASPTPTRAPSAGGNNNPPAAATEPPQAPAPPSSVGGGGNPGGGFELGGQVPLSLGPAPYMQQAGMIWVKFQAKWPYVDAATACSYVASGHAAGFKVLLSIPGPLYPQSIDFAAYTNHLAAVASCQPDAVEIWNEMNLDREWPAGQLDPASYVSNMLAPGFNAIKSASPGTIVIIGALAPTGFDNGTNAWSDQRYLQGLAAAGAANYANCVGAHHNSGTTSPSVRSGRTEGDHYSWYFLPTLEVTYFSMGATLPVCITEFGYLTPEGYGALPPAFAWGADNTVAEQAAWLKEGADIARGLGWVRLMIIWNVGFTQWDSDPQAGYSIIRPDGSCPACDLLP